MRKAAVGVVAVGVASALLISACGSSKSKSSSSGSGSASGGGTASGACKLPASAGSSSSAAASSSPPVTGTVSGKVGVILPDTTSSTRYTLYDAPLLKKAFDAAGVTSDIQNAGGSTAKFSSIAQSMIGEGVKVLIMDSLDPTSGAAVEAQAKTAGIKVIDYDRVNLGGSADYYVSFDNEGVGKLQGQALVDCLNLSKVSKPTIIEMDGGTDTDNNAVLFAKGANSVLKPLESSGKLKIASESVVKGWTTSLAAPTFTQALTAASGKVDGVLAANDDIANAVIGVLKQSGLNGHVAVTGQDAGIAGLQNIVTGQQSMTIFKDVKLEANAAAALAIALIAGKDPSTAGLTLSPFADPKNNRNIQALLLPPTVISQTNVQAVVTAGALTAAQICNGIQTDCDKLGIK